MRSAAQLHFPECGRQLYPVALQGYLDFVSANQIHRNTQIFRNYDSPGTINGSSHTIESTALNGDHNRRWHKSLKGSGDESLPLRCVKLALFAAQRLVDEGAEQLASAGGRLVGGGGWRGYVADRRADQRAGKEAGFGGRRLRPALFDRRGEAGSGPLDHRGPLRGDEGQQAAGTVIAEQDADQGVLAGGPQEGLQGGA